MKKNTLLFKKKMKLFFKFIIGIRLKSQVDDCDLSHIEKKNMIIVVTFFPLIIFWDTFFTNKENLVNDLALWEDTERTWKVQTSCINQNKAILL